MIWSVLCFRKIILTLLHAEQMGRGWKRSRRALKRELIHCLELVLAWVMMVGKRQGVDLRNVFFN